MQNGNITNTNRFTFHYVSIKSFTSWDAMSAFIEFTFHYVSIKSEGLPPSIDVDYNLHSTMYLLNPIAKMLMQ